MDVKSNVVIVVFLWMCAFFGVMVGCLGFGLGLLLLTVPQAIGLGILSVPLGALLGMTFGARKLVRVILKSMEESVEFKQATSVVDQIKSFGVGK